MLTLGVLGHYKTSCPIKQQRKCPKHTMKNCKTHEKTIVKIKAPLSAQTCRYQTNPKTKSYPQLEFHLLL